MRKINELVKRTRLLRVHACLIGYLKEQMPMFMGREKMQERLLKVGPICFCPHTPCLHTFMWRPDRSPRHRRPFHDTDAVPCLCPM
jgi:hypothetical protein